MRQTVRIGLLVVHISALLLATFSVSCQSVRARMGTGSTVPAASSQSSGAAPALPPESAPAASPHKSAWDNKPTDIPGDITRARAGSDKSPNDLGAAKEYATKIYNAAEERKFKHPPTAEWTSVATDAASRLDSIRKSQNLDKAGQAAVHTWRGTMLAFLGKNPEAVTELEGNLKLYPANLWVARQILKVYKGTDSVADNQAFCKRMRKNLKTEPKKEADDQVKELMTLCIEEHPENASGKVDVNDFKKFVPWASAADDKVLTHFVFGQVCVHESQRCFNRCIPTDPCNSRPYDLKWTEQCKHYEKICKEGCQDRDNTCFKNAENGKPGPD